MAGGSLLGSFFASWTGDRIGRRDSMAVACIIFICGSILMSAVQNRAMLIVSRIVNGWAVGMLTSQGYETIGFRVRLAGADASITDRSISLKSAPRGVEDV